MPTQPRDLPVLVARGRRLCGLASRRRCCAWCAARAAAPAARASRWP
ncbi:MAG: hypothetical protein WKG07_09550 [Hymenobacter sp.]